MKLVRFDAKVDVPVKYAIILNHYSDEEFYHLTEISPIALSSVHSRWPDEGMLKRVQNFHRQIENHSPMLGQSWCADNIDFWEQCFATFELFDNPQDAENKVEEIDNLRNSYEYKGHHAFVYPGGQLSAPDVFGVAAKTLDDALEVYETAFGKQDEEPHFLKMSFLELSWHNCEDLTGGVITVLEGFKSQVDDKTNKHGIFLTGAQ